MKRIRDLAKSFRDRSTSPVAQLEETLALIDKLNPRLNCYITILRDSAAREAEQAEKRFREGVPLGPLDGVPIAVKDLIYIRGVLCTAGSKILAGNVAPYDSAVIAKLRTAGAVLLGTTNLHEFAAGVTNDNPHFGPVRNPWDETRVSGGSSGGSAAAVASGMAAVAIGTDTAGSVRIPAALCGILGLKPTYGRVSRLGVVPLASSFDTVGTLTASAWDAAALLRVLAGHTPEDVTTSAAEVPDYVAEVDLPLKGSRIGVPRSYFHDLVDALVEDSFEGFIDRLRSVGCTIVDVELEGVSEAYKAFAPVRRAEATAFHLKWLESSPELYGDDVRKGLELGRQISAIEYVSAINMRPHLMEMFASSMAGLDAIATPTTSIAAPVIGQNTVAISGRETEIYSALNRLTLPFNVVGFPAITIPAGVRSGLPVGVQLATTPFEEGKLLRLAGMLETRFGPYPDPPLRG